MILSYQRNALLSLLAQFKVRLYEIGIDTPYQEELKDFQATREIIDRNIIGIERAIKKL